MLSQHCVKGMTNFKEAARQQLQDANEGQYCRRQWLIDSELLERGRGGAIWEK